MWTYSRNEDELAHYGVKGMKWGHRKSIVGDGKPKMPFGAIGGPKQPKMPSGALGGPKQPNMPSGRTARLQRKVDKQTKVAKSWDDTRAIKDKKGKTIYSESEVKEIRDAAYSKLNKLNYKLAISQKRDQINKGASAASKIWNKITGADKIQAEIEYDIEKRGRVNKAWRD